MEIVANWLHSSAWTGLIMGTAAGVAAAGGLAILVQRFRRNATAPQGLSQHELEARRRLFLFCSDAKVLADLAIQRHMSDEHFIRHLRAQPCYEALSPYLSEGFAQQLLRAAENGEGKSKLAHACRDEIERLQHQFRPSSFNEQ